MHTVAVLYCLPDNRCIYRFIEGAEVWDEARDARTFPGGFSVVAHPPCGPWGQMRQFCKLGDGAKELAPLAVEQVRQNGGVLEHPAGSSLWPTLGLPRPGEAPDAFGGYTLQVDQWDFGHLARKRTWLYIVGATPDRLPPPPPPREGVPMLMRPHRGYDPVACSGRHVPKSQRSVTPRAFAEWLVETARRCSKEA